MQFFLNFKVQFRMGDVKKSMETAKAVIDIQPDGHAHVLAGILAFKNNVRISFQLIYLDNGFD